MKHLRYLLPVFLVIVGWSGVQEPREGQTAWLLFPMDALIGTEQKTSNWTGNKWIEGDVVIRDSEGEPEWRMSGFPLLSKVEFTKLREEDDDELWNGADHYEYEFKNSNIKVFIHVPPDEGSEALAGAVAYTEAERDAYVQDLYADLANAWLTGSLAELSDPTQLALMEFAHQVVGATSVSTATFRDAEYLAANLGDSGVVLNTIQMGSEAERVAWLLNDRLLDVLKEFNIPASEAGSVAGVKIEAELGHRNFVHENSPEYDKIEIYASTRDIDAFANFDITSQEFVDRSFIIVNGNRISVPLAS